MYIEAPTGMRIFITTGDNDRHLIFSATNDRPASSLLEGLEGLEGLPSPASPALSAGTASAPDARLHPREELKVQAAEQRMTPHDCAYRQRWNTLLR